MHQPLVSLLDHPIDYAGLFPPASLPIQEALDQYLTILESDEAWLVDRFVVDVAHLPALARALAAKGYSHQDDHALVATVIGSPVIDPKLLKASFERDLQIIEDQELVPVSAYEVRVPEGSPEAAARAIQKIGIDLDELQVYLEFSTGTDFDAAISDAASVEPDLRFKLRTGGASSEAFPSSAQAAEFISAAASLELGFKFTAGLHQPLRHLDPEMNVVHHGFLNVMLASALAVSQDLSRQEIAEVLSIQDPSLIVSKETEILVKDLSLNESDIALFWHYFGGFGSCGVEEPVQGLLSLGYLVP